MSTTRSQELVAKGSGPASDYVLPMPGRGARDLLVSAPSPAGVGILQRHRESEVARSIGARIAALVECQQQFLGELRTCLQEVEGTVAEAARVRLQVQLRNALSVLDWLDAVQEDLQNEGRWARQGLQPIDLVAFCGEIAQPAGSGGRRISVTGEGSRAWWGHAGLLAETIEAGIRLVHERCRASGAIAIEVRARPAGADIRIAGSGEPSNDLDPGVVRAFRQAAERLGAVVRADDLGPGGVGFVLELPSVES